VVLDDLDLDMLIAEEIMSERLQRYGPDWQGSVNTPQAIKERGDRSALDRKKVSRPRSKDHTGTPEQQSELTVATWAGILETRAHDGHEDEGQTMEN
jgi:hypothetical protein